MTKAPRAGMVKTRLTPPLLPEEAAALHRCFLRDTAAAVAAAPGAARGLGVYTPRGEEAAFTGILPAHFYLLPQRGESLSDRLIHAAEDIFSLGFASLCFINSDSPTVPASVYGRAVEILAQPGAPLVLGPAEDGGYYLIGCQRLHRRLFEEIEWSTPRVRAQTTARAQEEGLMVELLPEHYDIDDSSTLRRLCAELLEGPKFSIAPATRQFLEQIITAEGRERIWPNASLHR